MKTKVGRRITCAPISIISLFVLTLFVACRCESVPVREKIFHGGWKKLIRGRRIRFFPSTSRANKYDKRNSIFMDESPSFFTWEAAIEGMTGVASSRERTGPFSLKPRNDHYKSTMYRNTTTQEQSNEMITAEEKIVVETSHQFIKTWSDFLCRGSISLGILKCATESGKANKGFRKMRLRRKMSPTDDPPTCEKKTIPSSSALMPRFVPFPVKLLEFGKVVESSLPYPSALPQTPSSLYRKSEQRSENFNDDNAIVLGCWDIPLQGGALILEGKDVEKRNQKKPKAPRRRPVYRGKLTFAIIKRKKLDTACDYGITTPNRYELVTGIVDYRPWLAGGGYPSTVTQNVVDQKDITSKIRNALVENRETTTKRWCHCFYLSTQSMVHAYVTWRFHKAWRHQLETAIRSTGSDASPNVSI